MNAILTSRGVIGGAVSAAAGSVSLVLGDAAWWMQVLLDSLSLVGGLVAVWGRLVARGPLV